MTASNVFEKKFAVHKVDYQLDEDVPLDSMKIRDTIQVRSQSDIAPADQVNLYAIQMQAGEEFPPVVLWGDVIIDGNTRIHAARKSGRTALPAYRVSCRNERHARQLGASLNQTNGRRLNAQEARIQAVGMMEDGYSDSFIARELGTEATKVRRWRKDEDAREHAARLAIEDKFADIAATTRSRLAEVPHDAPFKAVVEALHEFDVPTKDVNEVLEEVKKAPSDDEAVAAIEARKDDWDPRGTRKPGRGPKVTAREANRSIGALLNKDVSYWVDMTAVDDVLPKWEAMLKLADQVIAEYRRLGGQAA